MSGDLNNNKMERFNGELRDREKIVRGVKKSDSPLLIGYQIFQFPIESDNRERNWIGLLAEHP